MRLNFIKLLSALSLSLATLAHAQSTNSLYVLQPVNQVVPDQNINGLFSTITISGMDGSVQSLQVGLEITYGWTGDYFAYLAGPTGTYSVLLNRPGVTAGNPFGYSDTGFNLVLSSDAANNVHFYQSGYYSLDANGLVVGTYAPDGRNIDPRSLPSAFDSALTGTGLSPVLGTNPNGDWTLFVSDASGGYQGTLANWSLTLTTIPEPKSNAVFLLGAFLVLCFCRRFGVGTKN